MPPQGQPQPPQQPPSTLYHQNPMLAYHVMPPGPMQHALAPFLHTPQHMVPAMQQQEQRQAFLLGQHMAMQQAHYIYACGMAAGQRQQLVGPAFRGAQQLGGGGIMRGGALPPLPPPPHISIAAAPAPAPAQTAASSLPPAPAPAPAPAPPAGGRAVVRVRMAASGAPPSKTADAVRVVCGQTERWLLPFVA